MSKTIAIVQSNYIPWKGYFDMIAAVDEFILFDEVQFTRRDWRNRNRIKTPSGLKWLTVPVKVKGKYFQKIIDTEIDGITWAESHWNQLQQNYRQAPYFDEIAEWLYPLYENKYSLISELNRTFLEAICNYLNINTVISNSLEYTITEGKTQRLVNICLEAGATEYITGPAAKNYIDHSLFDDKNIRLSWFDYDGYQSYPQLWGDFIHEVSILDLLFNCGTSSASFMKYLK